MRPPGAVQVGRLHPINPPRATWETTHGRWHRCRMGFPLPAPFPTKRTEETIPMKAIVVTDQAAGTAGMKLVERPEPQAAINDVVVQVHASGFVPTELAWPSTWTDRRDRDRTPSIPGHELAGDRWRRQLSRRSQKGYRTWTWIDMLADHWLPRPRILHPWPEQRFAVTHPR